MKTITRTKEKLWIKSTVSNRLNF